jgi:tRNA pseudouridine38-40 synthase
MKRYLFEIAYNGANYFGWQIQPNQVSVQTDIENALSKLFDQNHYSITGCGRTDTGVHANYYVFHVDLPEKWSVGELKYKLNRILSNSIAIFSVREVSEDFHARFSAIERTYRYFIHLEKDVFSKDVSLLIHNELDFVKMNEACESFIGTKDFTSFSKLHTDVRTNICSVYKAQWINYQKNKYYFEISADRFLRNMVRATVGTLLEVGYGKIEPSEIETIIQKMNRNEAKTSVPAHALFLWDVKYPKEFELKI